MNRRTLVTILVLLALLLGCISAAGETMYLDDQGIRFYVPEGWRTVTKDNVLQSEDMAKEIGTTTSLLKAQFDAHSILLYAIDENHDAFALRLLDSPLKTYSGDVYSFSKGNRTEFRDAILAANPNAAGDWDETLPSFLRLKWEKDVQGIPVHTLAYQTLMYGKIISFECDSFGEAPASDTISSLQKGAAAILFLGAKAEAETTGIDEPTELTLPETTPNEGVAEITVVRNTIPLTVDELPLNISAAELPVTGTTLPNASLRYYMNGAGIERFKADDNGRFEITAERFTEGRNTIRIDAGTDSGSASISTRIFLTRDETPAILEAYEFTCDTETLTIRGKTIPDATVSFKNGSRTVKPTVNADGSFTAELSTPKVKDYTFTFEIKSSLYKTAKPTVIIHRLGSPDEQSAAFLNQKGKAAKKNRAANGSVEDLCYLGSKRLVVFAADDGTDYAVYVENFLDFDLDKKGQMLLILTDENVTLNNVTYPSADLFRFNPAN